MAICRQVCQYNTLYGCKVKEYSGVCPLTNTVKQIKEYMMTNADRIRAMSDEELASVIMCPYQFDGELDCKEHNCFQCSLKWLQQPAEGE